VTIETFDKTQSSPE